MNLDSKEQLERDLYVGQRDSASVSNELVNDIKVFLFLF